MKLKKYIIIVIAIVLTGFKVEADVITSLQVKTGYNSNIFGDAYEISDSYSTLGSSLKYYPTSSAEISIYGDYSVYFTNNDLSNFNGEISLTLMPINDSSDFSLLIHSSIVKRKFGTLFSIYDNDGINSNINLFFRASEKLTLKTSAYYSKKSFSNSVEVSDQYIGASGGLNFTLGNDNALDFETYIYRKEYDPENSSLTNSNLSEYDFIDYKFNFSRPLGNSTGLSLNYNYHNLLSYSDFNIPGYTIDYLSPWSTLWNGQSIALSLKHILKNQSIVELNSTYIIKDYVNNIEFTDEDQIDYEVFERSDESFIINLNFYKNFITEKYIIKPVISITATMNKSSMSLYEYNTFNLSVSSSLSF